MRCLTRCCALPPSGDLMSTWACLDESDDLEASPRCRGRRRRPTSISATASSAIIASISRFSPKTWRNAPSRYAPRPVSRSRPCRPRVVYLQDRQPGRTPRWRGVTLLHELRNAGVPVAIAGDNCREHLVSLRGPRRVRYVQAGREDISPRPSAGHAAALVGRFLAAMIRAEPIGRIAAGGPARLILFAARSLNELGRRPQADRIVLNNGRRVRDRLPDYEELDARRVQRGSRRRRRRHPD